jgi:NAD-dependent dihydropyrimidine dehydrogenase PreA subunit
MSIESIDMDLCTGCGICVNSCCMDVLRMDPATGRPTIAYLNDCILCEFCALDCPEEAITVGPDKHSPLFVSWG